MIVFDFDKTLTEKDTLAGFFYKVGRDYKKYFLIRKLFYGMLVVLCYFGLINNTELKGYGVRIFLSKVSKKNVQNAAKDYASQIKKKEKIEKVLFQSNIKKLIICSASFKEYIQYCYPEHLIVASELNFKNDVCIGLKTNLYGNKKKEALLLRYNISEIDELYTDSFSDQPLMNISKKTYYIQKNRIKEL